MKRMTILRVDLLSGDLTDQSHSEGKLASSQKVSGAESGLSTAAPPSIL